MATLKEVYQAKESVLNDDSVLRIEKLKGGYAMSLWHNVDKFDFTFKVKNRAYFFDMIIKLFNEFDFNLYIGGNIEDLTMTLNVPNQLKRLNKELK